MSSGQFNAVAFTRGFCIKILITPFLLLGLNLAALAQITVTFPSSRAVFQRDNANQATLYIGGYFEELLDQVEARVVPRVSGQGTATAWTTIQNNPTGGQFYGALTVTGGWYSLEVRGIFNGTTVTSGSVDRVGIGEVFVVAGQSNATGGDGLPNGPGATDDRVSSIDFQNLNPNNGTPVSYSGTMLPCPTFVHLDAVVKTAPFGNYAWCWGVFGDLVAQRLNVPVLIFNAGWSGTGMINWEQSIGPNAVSVSAFGYTYPAGMPFGNLRLALNNYIAQQGYRAVLWHHGELDNYSENSRSGYRNSLMAVVNSSRTLSGKSNLAWVVARASRFNVGGNSRLWQPVIDGQNDVIGLNGSDPALQLAQVYAGPATDPLQGPGVRGPDNVHFTGNGLTLFAEAWNNSLTTDFFSNSTPYAAMPPPAPVVVCGPGSNQLTFQAPGGGQYRWLPEYDCNQVLSASPTYAASTGKYRLQVIDGNQNKVLSPLLKVPANTSAQVSITGNTSVSEGSTLSLYALSANGSRFQWTGPANFSTNLQSFALVGIPASSAGTYEVTATNAYGCQASANATVQVFSSLESVTSGDWHTPSTWTCGCLPTAATEVKINPGHTVTIEGSTAKAKSLLLQSGLIQFLSGGGLLISQ